MNIGTSFKNDTLGDIGSEVVLEDESLLMDTVASSRSATISASNVGVSYTSGNPDASTGDAAPGNSGVIQIKLDYQLQGLEVLFHSVLVLEIVDLVT